MARTRFLLITVALLLPAMPGHAQLGANDVLNDLGRRVGEVEEAVRIVEELRGDADDAQAIGRLGCLDDSLSWLSGLQIAGRAAVDEYAVALGERDEAAMVGATNKVDRVHARYPELLAEARACREGGGPSDERCHTWGAPSGVACVEVVVAMGPEWGPPDDEYGAVVGGFSRPPDASPTR